MTIATLEIRERLTAFLAEQVEVEEAGDRLAILTPASYPDGEGVVVYVSERERGRFEVSDLGRADARLIAAGPGVRSLRPVESEIADRFDVVLESGVLISRAGADELPETCWRVAEAAVAIAGAATWHKPQRTRERVFADVIARELTASAAAVEVKRDTKLRGASGREYRASLYVPDREVVIEPVTPEQTLNRVAAVYVEFGDLGLANGYQLLAVIDDRDGEDQEQAEGLLGQVGIVARWSRRQSWVERVTTTGFA
jgi:hypothetical protein